MEAGIIPQEAFGDFDSITEEELMQIQKRRRPSMCIRRKKIIPILKSPLTGLYKRTGNHSDVRCDGRKSRSLLGNIQLLYKALHKNTDVELIDRQNDIQMFGPGRYTIEEKARRRYISFIPFTEAADGLTLDGFKYPLIIVIFLWVPHYVLVTNSFIHEVLFRLQKAY